jgi:ribonucleoside-diphosphate reductase alpha chain
MLFYLNSLKKRKEIIILGARNFAMRHRALGLGVLGYHSYLQKNMIPFESFEATQFNARAFRHIKEQANKLQELANIYGEPELLKGYGLRNTTRWLLLLRLQVLRF